MIDINDFIKVQESRQNHDDEAVKKAVNEYDEALERWGVQKRNLTFKIKVIGVFCQCVIELYLQWFRYIPILMAQAKIYWDLENYPQVEKIFRKSVEFCNEHEVWKLNVAHVLFMQV